MPINSIEKNTVAPMNNIGQELRELNSYKNHLSGKISRLQNSVTNLNKSIDVHNNEISGNLSLIKSLNSVTAKHGDNAYVRLKNDHFKYGRASNFFNKILHGNRYQTEREAAVKMINTEERSVSAGMAIGNLRSRIISARSEINKLKEGVDKYYNIIADAKTIKYGVENKIDELAKIETDARKADEKNHKIRQNFSMIYQCNVGCKAINNEARYQFSGTLSAGKVSGDKVVAEYRRVHGYEIFSRGNKDLESTIKVNCSNLSELVKTSAKAWYTPTQENITTYRGQGMTPSGIDKLMSQFYADKQNNTETVYNLGQFFSTSENKNIAREFANNSQDAKKVILTIKGNSSNKLCIPGGLKFENDEGERLYSPHANFKVTAVSRKELSNSTYYHVTLKEVSEGGKAQPLPY